VDDDESCPPWVKAGECDLNVDYMHVHCRFSCDACTATPPPPLPHSNPSVAAPHISRACPPLSLPTSLTPSPPPFPPTDAPDSTSPRLRLDSRASPPPPPHPHPKVYRSPSPPTTALDAPDCAGSIAEVFSGGACATRRAKKTGYAQLAIVSEALSDV
jgi:hypothetical protein